VILDESFHGFYIHGQSPSGSADVTLTELKMKLDQEATGNN